MTLTLADLRTSSHDQLLKLVDRRHPEFKESLSHWRFLDLSYRGGRKWIDKNLFTYHKEGRREFRQRKERAYRFPHAREVISLVNKYVFKGTIERKPANELPSHIREFWGAATLLKRPIQNLMDTISTATSTFGRVWVVVDNNVPTTALTEAERKASKGRCYAYYIDPTKAYDFAYDSDGELEWFLCGEAARDDNNPLTSDGKVRERFRLWTKEFTCAIDVKVEGAARIAKIDEATVNEHNLGLVPVFPADHLTSDDLYKTAGLIEDVAYMDRAIANYLSNLDVIIQDQTFSQLAIPFQGMLPTEGTGDDVDEEDEQVSQLQVMGTKRVFAYNAEGGAAPTFISPDVKQAGLIMSAVTKIIGEIYHSIGMAGERTKEDNAAGIDNSSGVAKAYDFEKLNAMLAAKARSLQHIEKNLVRLVNAWNRDAKELQETEDYVTYPETFDVRNLADEMDNAQRLSVMNAPKALRRFQMIRMAKKMFPQANAAEIKEIVEEIESDWLEEPPMDLAGIAAPGAPTLPKSRVPGKKNAQGENNKGSVKAADKQEDAEK